jgi:cysteine desulfurase
MARKSVYLDHHATTPVDPRVLEAMLPYFAEHFGNPGSGSHAWGWTARDAVEKARRQVAGLIGSASREIIFTSGATESNNLAIRGAARMAPEGRRHVIVSGIEHKSVLEPADQLTEAGWRVSCLPVGPDGIVDLETLRAAMTPDTALASVMAANNEIGVVQPIAEIGALCRSAGALFHVDAAQAVGRIPVDVEAMHIDLLSLTGHKMYGPKGCGALFVRRRVEVAPLISGGGQERGLRSGTLNVPGIVGLGEACAICANEMAAEADRLARLRDRLLEGLRHGLPAVVVNGSLTQRLPNNLHVGFPGVDGASLIIGISDIAVSTGAACSSGSEAPSHVLQALGGEATRHASIRFGLGRQTTDEDIDYAIEKFVAVVGHLQQKTRAV